MLESFSWLVDMIIVHCIAALRPNKERELREIWKEILLRRDVIVTPEVRQRISWHVTEICDR